MDLRAGALVTKNGERTNAPTMSRAAQDRIGHELRQMYSDLLRKPLPENLVAPLRACDELQTTRKRLADAVSAIRGESLATYAPSSQSNLQLICGESPDESSSAMISTAKSRY